MKAITRQHLSPRTWATACALLAVSLQGADARAHLDGVHGHHFDLVAREGYVSTPDGGNIYSWGYALAGSLMQYPGPTMLAHQGSTITVTLRNELPAWAGPVSIEFPGQQVTASGGVAGTITQEAPPDGVTVVTYTFLATRPGTFTYFSATRPDLQIEMGLVGALVIYPHQGMGRAYEHPATRFDRETLFVLTEMDPAIHRQVEISQSISVDTTAPWPVYWFINGRTAPDTMAGMNVPYLPHQPYDCMPRMHPGEKLLMRVIGAGRDLHPFHHHGNHARVIARDGRLLQSAPDAGPDLAYDVFTIPSAPGQTVDALFEWTGKDLGWDIYGDPADNGHTCVDGNADSFDDTTHEYCPDHGKPIPVVLPEMMNLTFGGSYSGSPYLGTMGMLPPGQGGLNPNAGFVHMWHSHNEKEMVNNDIFPGGMMTMLVVEAPGVPIP
jgi:FtsP/CotA-like multicopper oxidase with cupredoxin domain